MIDLHAEHLDHQPTFANESAAAFDLSRREANIINQSAKLNELLTQGKSVLIQQSVRYCGFTDAILGTSLVIIEAFDTKEAADEAYASRGYEEQNCEDFAVGVRHPKPAVPVAAAVVYDEDEVPF